MAISAKASKKKPVNAASEKIVFFGDSLSDHGNNGKYTDKDGKVWSEIFPKLVNATVSYNYAISESSSSSLRMQISNYLKSKPPKTDKAIYSLLSGGNDIKNDPFQVDTSIQKIISNLKGSINKIHSSDKGSTQKQFLIFNLPTTAPAANSFSHLTHYKVKSWYNGDQTTDSDDYYGLDYAFFELLSYGIGGLLENINFVNGSPRHYFNQYVQDASYDYTQSLKNLVCEFRQKNIDVQFIDLAEHHRQIVEQPDKYGVNPDAHCLTSAGCNNGLYFDLIHFSARGHELFAHFVTETLGHPELQQTWDCNKHSEL